MIFVFLADGFEEIEALATVDYLRRCELDVVTVGIGSQEICGAHNIYVLADISDLEISTEVDFDAIVLPGGMPGTLNLEKSKTVSEFIDKAIADNKLVCAICAAPSILGHKGLLDGKRATCFPGFETQLGNAEFTGNSAEKDGNIITGKGAGAVFDFAYLIGEELAGKQKSTHVKVSMQCPQ